MTVPWLSHPAESEYPYDVPKSLLTPRHDCLGYTVKLLTRYTLVYEDGPVSVTFEKDSVPGQIDVFLSSARSVGAQAFAMDGGPAALQLLERLQRALEWKGFAVRLIEP